MKALILLVITLLIGCASVPSNNKPLIFKGIVRKEDGSNLSNAKVTLYEDLTSWSWNPGNWYLRPDRKIIATRTGKSGEFILSTSENISGKKLKIVIERVKRLMPHEDPNIPESIMTPPPIQNPIPEKLYQITVPNGFTPEP